MSLPAKWPKMNADRYTLWLCAVGELLLLIPSLYDFILIFICCFVFPELLSFTFLLAFSVVAYCFYLFADDSALCLPFDGNGNGSGQTDSE